MTRIESLITTLEQSHGLDLSAMLTELHLLHDEMEQMGATIAEEQEKVMQRNSRIAALETQNANLNASIQTLRSRTPSQLLEKYVDNWLSANDCEPEDADAVYQMVEEAMDEMLSELSRDNPGLFGVEREFTVEFTFKASGTHTVTARNEGEAHDIAREALDNVDYGFNNLDIINFTVDSCTED